MNEISITEREDTFSGLDLHIIQKKASIHAEKFPQIQEITLHKFIDRDDEPWLAERKNHLEYILVFRHEDSFDDAYQKGEYYEATAAFLHREDIGGLKYKECAIDMIGPDDTLPDNALRLDSLSLYARLSDGKDETASKETPEEKRQKKLREQKICDEERDEFFGRLDKRTPEEKRRGKEKKSKMAARLLRPRKPVDPDYGPDPTASMTEETAARYWWEKAREAMNLTGKPAVLMPVPKPAIDAPPIQTVDDYVRGQRAKARDKNMIAYELQKKFGLSALDVARALGLDAGLNKTQIGAMKKRGERAINKGKEMIEQE
jgi:hypothetical protein